MKPQRDYYEVLGVERDADQRAIKRAFLKLARKLHPDVNNAPDAEARFKEVNEAYSVLSDERRRANYDQFGDADGPGGFGSEYVDMSDIFGGGFGISDIFDSFFGGGGSHGARAARTRGRDMGIALRITLEEAAAGCTKTVAYDRLAPCDDCGGTGVGEGGKETTCDRCHGTGRVVEVQRTIFGQMQSQTVCPECHGTGHVVDKPCETCEGEGRTPVHETVKVDIPAGVRTGQSIRVEGRGEAGVRGDATGDLVVTIQVLEHERFERQGDDLYMVSQVDALDAILGTTITCDGILPDDKISFEVPAGTQYGQRISAGAYGVPHLGGHGRGELICAIQVVVPDDLTPDAIETLQQVQWARGKGKKDAPEPEPPAEEKKTRRRRPRARKMPGRSKRA